MFRPRVRCDGGIEQTAGNGDGTAERSPSGWLFLDSVETYLLSIYEMSEEDERPPNQSRLADRLGLTRNAVREQVGRLVRQKLVEIAGDALVTLTEQGGRRATTVARKHRLAERMLVDVIGVDWSRAHGEACRLQHVLGDGVERRLVELLDTPWLSCYGGRIPGLADITSDPTRWGPVDLDTAGSTGCDEVAAGGGGTVVVRRINEGAQRDTHVLAALGAVRAVPGSEIDVCASPDRRADTVRITARAGDMELTRSQARYVIVGRRHGGPDAVGW